MFLIKNYFLFFLILILSSCSSGTDDLSNNKDDRKITKPPMQVSSPMIRHGQPIPEKYTCEGEDINPQITVLGAPEKTKSFAVIVDDPDAGNKTWNHWIMWDIPPEFSSISENSVPVGAVQGKQSFGNYKYEGPCPPSGEHRYFFKVFALNNMLKLPEDTSKTELLNYIDENLIEKAEFYGIYSKKQTND